MAEPVSAPMSGLLALYLRPAASQVTAGDGSVTYAFNPPLLAGEQATFDRIQKLGRSLVTGITPAEWEALEPDIAGLVTYQALVSPTLAQTVQAVKAQSRILRAMLKS